MNISLLLLGIIVIIFVSRRMRRQSPYYDFDLASTSEKFAMCEQTHKSLRTAENLVTDIQASSPERQIIIHMEWLADDEIMQQYDLYLDGGNLASEKLQEVFDGEINELRTRFAYECDQLSRVTRNRKNCRKYHAEIGRMGELVSAFKGLCDMRQNHGD